MDTYLLRVHFTNIFVDPNLYIRLVHGESIIIILYVDELLVTVVQHQIQECKKQLATNFDMNDLGIMHYSSGIEVWKKPSEIYLGQGKYVIKIIQKFGMMGNKPMMTPMITNLHKVRSSESSLAHSTCYRKLIGPLMYLVNTRPYICFEINVLNQFQIEPKHDHGIEAKHILRYLRGTIHHCLQYTGNEIQLVGYTYLDWGGSETTGRSIIVGFFNLGSSMVPWMSRKRDIISLSSVEVEYVDAS